MTTCIVRFKFTADMFVEVKREHIPALLCAVQESKDFPLKVSIVKNNGYFWINDFCVTSIKYCED